LTEDKANPISLRFTVDELDEMRHQAFDAQRSLAAHVRELALIGMRQSRPGVTVTRLPSGGELIAYPGGTECLS
jgi:hypothetical protein